MSFFPKTLSGLRNIDADHIFGITFSGVILDNLEQSILNMNTNTGITFNSFGVSLINSDNTYSLIGVSSANFLNSQNGFNTLVSTSVSVLNNYKSSSGISIANLINSDFTIGTSINSIQSLIGSSYSNFNSDIDTLFDNDELIGVSIGNIVSDVDTLFNNDILISVSIDSLDDTVNGLIDVLGISFNNNQSEVNSIYSTVGDFLGITYPGIENQVNSVNTIVNILGSSNNALENSINIADVAIANLFGDNDTLVSVVEGISSSYTTLNTAFEIADGVLTAVDTAFSAFAIAQNIINTQVQGYETLNTSAVEELQAQVDDLVSQEELETGTSFPSIMGHINTFYTDIHQIGVSIDNETYTIGVSIGNLNEIQSSFTDVINGVSLAHIEFSLGASIAFEDNRINNLIGVSVFNIDVWKSYVIGSTLPAISVSIANINIKDSNLLGITIPNLASTINALAISGINTDSKLSVFLGSTMLNLASTINSLCVSEVATDSRISLFLGTTLLLLNTTINFLGVSIQGLNVSHSVFGVSISSLGSSLSVLDNVLSNSIASLTTTGNSLGSSIQSLNTSHSQLISGLGTTSISLATSISQLNTSTGILLANLGTSTSNLESNKADKLLFGTSITNVSAKDSIMYGVSFPNYGISIANEESNKMDKLLISTSTSNIDSRVGILYGVSVVNLSTSIANLENHKSDALLFGSSITTINNFASNLNNSLLGTSISNDDAKIGILIGVSYPKLLTNTDLTLPSTFRNSNLNAFGTSGRFSRGSVDSNDTYDLYVGGHQGTANHTNTNVVIASNGQDSCSANLYFGTPFGVGNNGNKCAIKVQGISNTSIGDMYFCLNNNTSTHNINAGFADSRMIISHTGDIGISGNLSITGNITTLGTFSSPLTTTIGTSVSVLSSQTATFLGSSYSHLITNTDITLPSSFTSSSLNSTGTLANLSVSGTINCNNVSGTGLKVKHQNSTGSITLGMANTNDCQIIGSNDMYFYVNGGAQTLQLTGGNGIFSNNLNVNGTFTTPFIDFTDTSQEKISLFGTNNSGYGIGITGSTTMIYSDAGHDVAIGYGGYTSFVELLRTKGSDGSTNVKNLNVSGTLSSPLTTLIGTSISTINNQNSTLLGTSYNHLLTDSTISANLNTLHVNDNLLLSSSASSNSYITFTDLSDTSPGTFYTGLISNNLRLFSGTKIDFYSGSALNATLSNTDFQISQPTKISYSALANVVGITASHASFAQSCLTLNTSIASGTGCKFISGTANNSETFRITNNGDVKNLNNSYSAISSLKFKENIQPARDYTQDLMKLQLKTYNLIGTSYSQLGLIAEDTELIFPSLVDNDYTIFQGVSQSCKSIKYSVLNSMLLGAFQKLRNDFDSYVKKNNNQQ